MTPEGPEPAPVLTGKRMPDAALMATTGGTLRLDDPGRGPLVLFVYPRTGRPDEPDAAEWHAVPGARGCTAEACSFRDLRADFAALGWTIAGCSTQSPEYQVEAAKRLHLPYPLLSDAALALATGLGLRTFVFDGDVLYRRITLLVHRGTVVRAIDPGDDPSGHVEEVLEAVRVIAAERPRQSPPPRGARG